MADLPGSSTTLRPTLTLRPAPEDLELLEAMRAAAEERAGVPISQHSIAVRALHLGLEALRAERGGA